MPAAFGPSEDITFAVIFTLEMLDEHSRRVAWGGAWCLGWPSRCEWELTRDV